VEDPTDKATAGPATEAHRPRLLIADAGQVLRGALGDALRQRYELREAGDGESAWQTILLDTALRALVLDCGSAGLRGLELVARMRASKVARIRELPAIALVERDGSAEAERAAALDAAVLCLGEPPAMSAAAELLARLRVLVELSDTRATLADSRDALESSRTIDPETDLLTPAAFDRQVEKHLSYARRSLIDMAMICIRVELKLPGASGWEGEIEQRMKLVGRALGSSIRLEDLATRSGPAEFCVATQKDGMTDMLQFAARLRKVLENVDAAGPGVEVWTSIGAASLSEELRWHAVELRVQAQKRAQAALAAHSRRIMLGSSEVSRAGAAQGAGASIDLSLALTLIAAGRSNEVLPHLPRLLQQINPLLQLVRQQQELRSGVRTPPPSDRETT
jgi:PleD family two-component response regulator